MAGKYGKRQLIGILGLCAVVLTPAWSQAAEAFIEGTHFQRIDVPVPTGIEEGRVEVVEVFSYLCIHCYSFDPLLSRWEAERPEDVEFNRVPAVFSQDWALLAQAFYTARALGVTQEMHGPLFEALHVRRLDLRDTAVMANLFATSAGVPEADFQRAFTSFSTKSRVMQGDAKTRAYGVTGVPTMIVDGKYRVDARMAGSNEQMLEVVDFLVERERRLGQ